MKDIRRATRRHFSAEDKIRIVLEGLRGEDSIAELCRKEGIAQNRITPGRRTSWRRARSGWRAIPPGHATTDEVKDLRREANALKESWPS